MIFSAVVVVSALALLPLSLASIPDAHKKDCVFVCPGTDSYEYALSASNHGDGTLSCSYSGGSGNLCTYDVSTGALVGDEDGCSIQAVQRCSPRRGRQLKQVVVRRGGYDGHPDVGKAAPSPNVGWKRYGYGGPSHTWNKRDPKPTPSPSPPSKPWPQPPKEQACDHKCPEQDLAKGPLTDGGIRDSALYCSYSPQDSCKYSTKTGLLLEDNNDGNCPQTATLSRPRDRRYI